MHYLTIVDVIHIHERLFENNKGVRDRGALEAAIARPRYSFYGEEQYPTLTEKAAALLHSLIQNHPFVDGNKRTATVATDIFLSANGRAPKWNPAEALAFIVEIAEGKHDVPEIAQWLDRNTDSE